MRARGVTLVELLVVLTVLGVLFGVSGLALASLAVPRDTESVRAMRRARAAAIRSVERRTSHGVLFLPDGRAIGPNVDPLTGTPHAQ